MILFRYFALLVCFLLVAPLFAVDAPKVTFRGLATEGQLEGIYFTNAKGEPQEFRVNDYVRSEFYRAPGGATLTFYKLLPPEVEGESPIQEVVGSVEWPLGGGPYLILVSRSGGKNYFTGLQDDDSSFPMGSFRFLNASSHELLIYAGPEVVSLPPNEVRLIKPPLPEEGKGVLFQVYKLAGNKELIVYSNVWPVTSDMRSMVFIFDQPNKNYPIVVKRIHENKIQLQRQREREAQEEKEAKK